MKRPECFSETTQRIQRAMLGDITPDLQIHRQACRVTEDDSDELVLVCTDSHSWWVAQRVSHRLTVWAFADDEQASAAFDRFVDTGPAWREATPGQDDGLARTA